MEKLRLILLVKNPLMLKLETVPQPLWKTPRMEIILPLFHQLKVKLQQQKQQWRLLPFFQLKRQKRNQWTLFQVGGPDESGASPNWLIQVAPPRQLWGMKLDMRHQFPLQHGLCFNTGLNSKLKGHVHPLYFIRSPKPWNNNSSAGAVLEVVPTPSPAPSLSPAPVVSGTVGSGDTSNAITSALNRAAALDHLRRKWQHCQLHPLQLQSSTHSPAPVLSSGNLSKHGNLKKKLHWWV